MSNRESISNKLLATYVCTGGSFIGYAFGIGFEIPSKDEHKQKSTVTYLLQEIMLRSRHKDRNGCATAKTLEAFYSI